MDRAGEGGGQTESPAAMDGAGEGGGQTESPAAMDGAGEGGGQTESPAATDRGGEGGGQTESPAAMETPPPPETEKCQAEGQGPPGPTSLAGKELDEAICSICKGYLTDPVTIPCGHNFCRGCITQCCVGLSCPQCGATFQKRDLTSNTPLDSTVASIEPPESNPGQSRREGNQKPLPEDSKGSPARRSHAVIPMAKASHKSKGETSTSSRSENASVQEQEATSTRPLEPKESSRAIGCYVRVTLDEDTANPALIRTEDQRGVRYTDTPQDLSDNPERFDKRFWVLGSQGFTEGTVYWEVEVGNEVFWVVAVAKESVKRKGWVNWSPKAGIWAIDWSRQIPASSQSTPPQSSKHRRIRVCLNYEKGQVTFFNADNEAVIHTICGASFDGERIRPFFGTKSHLSLRPCPETEGWAGDTPQ